MYDVDLVHPDGWTIMGKGGLKSLDAARAEVPRLADHASHDVRRFGGRTSDFAIAIGWHENGCDGCITEMGITGDTCHNVAFWMLGDD